MTRRALLAAVLASVLVAGTAASGAAAEPPEPTWQRAGSLFHYHHSPQTEPRCAGDFEFDNVELVDCAGLIDAFDGQSLSVTVMMPKVATGRLPTLLYLHAFTSNRGEFSDTISGHAPPFFAQSFAAKGYAVVMPASRGSGGSCGHTPNTGPHDKEGHPQLERPHGPPPPGLPAEQEDFTCSRGWSHILERDFEVKDMKDLLGTLVDHGVADPERLVASGVSFGGILTWMLAASRPWVTPDGDGPIRLAAAVPIVAATSIQNSAAPNGRATDDPDGARSLERPYGIPKLSGLANLAALGRTNPTGGPMRWNDTDPSELHSYTTAWLAFWAQGEPFDKPEGRALTRAFRNKGAYNSDDYFEALRAGNAAPVPVLAVQGWTDASFPAVEALQMYRKLKVADPDYPASIFLADIGHAPARGTAKVTAAWRVAAVDFLDAYALQGGSGAPAPGIVSMSTECVASLAEAIDDTVHEQDHAPMPPDSSTVAATDWDAIHPTTVTLRDDGPKVTSSRSLSPLEELRSDPGFVHDEWWRSNGCTIQAAGTYDDSGAITRDVPAGGITLLGLPKLTADYRLSGVDATVIAKLWDLDPATGARTLVTRGLYRLSLAGGDNAVGRLKFKLFGNHYHIAAGHKIQLELSQTDVPFLKPDRFESSITYSGVKVELPLAAMS